MEHVNKVVQFDENEEEVKVVNVDGGGDERDEEELSSMDKLPTETEEQEEVPTVATQADWKNLSLLQVLEQYYLNQKKKRGEAITKVIRDFFLNAEETSWEIRTNSKRKRTGNARQLQTEWQKENPIAKALRNPLVVKMILGYLNISTVLKCRLVNKVWLTLSTELLTKSRDEDEDALRIKFRYCEEAKTYIKYFDGILRGEIKTLDSFNKLLSKLDKSECSSFPCTNFEIKDVVLSRYQIKKFFRLHGSKIKGLRLSFAAFETDAVTTETFRDLLMNKAPNVECLTVFGMSIQWNHILKEFKGQVFNSDLNSGGSENQVTFSLPTLRCLRIQLLQNFPLQGLTRLEKEIALCAPALKTVHVQGHASLTHNSGFDFLTSISKAHLISNVSIRPELSCLDFLKKMAQSPPFSTTPISPRPRFTHLLLSLEFVDASARSFGAEKSISFEDFLQFATPLLECSKNSLQFLSMPKGKRVSRFLKQSEFPTLKNARVVELYCKEESSRIGCPIPIKEFNRIFLNARKLKLTDGTEATGVFFASQGSAADGATSSTGTATEIGVIPQITSLALYGNFAWEFWSNIPYIFCNVVSLDVKDVNVLPVLPILWSFTSLHIKKTCEPSPATIFPGLDAAITGFPEDACTQLYTLYPEILEEETVREIRINRSILDLKYLEELHIKFLVSFADELPDKILTVVSGAYAFQRMRPKVKVHIETHLSPEYQQKTSGLISRNQQIEKVMKPLLPYANVISSLDTNKQD